MIAMNSTGWENIKRLQSIAWKHGWFKKPRVSLDDLLKYNEGIIITTGCVDGIIGYWLHRKDANPEIQKMNINVLKHNIYQRLKKFKSVFKNRLFGEIQLNDADIQEPNNRFAISACNKLGIPIILTGDIHYIKPTDTELHDIVKCVLWRDQISDPDNHTYDTKELWFKTIPEIFSAKNKFHPYIGNQQLAQYILNTHKVKDMISEFDILSPQRSMPVVDYSGKNGYQVLLDLCRQHPDFYKITKYKKYKLRFNSELRLILSKNFVDYFWIVWDICRAAREMNIPFNSRGSVCGSLLAYLLNITWIDPIRFNTPFERFLSEDRDGMPDIDIDFPTQQREKIYTYLEDKYGEECVARICALVKWKPKSAVKDVCRVYGIPFPVINNLLGKIDTNDPWEEMYKHDDIVEFFAKHPVIEDKAQELLGLVRQFTIHASGVLVTADEMRKWCPIAYQKDIKITEWDGTMLDELQLLKIDLLAVNMLDIVSTTAGLIKDDRFGDISSLFRYVLDNLDDYNIYKMISEGKTVGTFQLGGSGSMRNLATQMKPDRFNDIVALISLHRTALLVMNADQDYIRRKHGENFNYIHPEARHCLHDTYGVLLYQFQTVQLAHDLAGFSYQDGEAIRKSIKKKDAKVMLPWKEKFIEGCKTKNNIGAEEALYIWGYIEAFSEYGFGRAHATSYALLGYLTCFLKLYYRKEFMTALLRHNIDKTDHLLEYMLDCSRMKIEVVKPDINKSTDQFELEGGRIYAPIDFIKGIGGKALDKIMSERRTNGEYLGFDDFRERSGVNITVLAGLILCDAFAKFEKKEVLWEQFITERKENISRQLYCMDCKYRMPVRIVKDQTPKCPVCGGERCYTGFDECSGTEFDENYLNEKYYGFNIWNDNLAKIIPKLEAMGYRKLSDLEGYNGVVKVVFEIKKVRKHIDKNENEMAFVEVSDNIVHYDLVVFASVYEQIRQKLIVGKLCAGVFKKNDKNLVIHNSYITKFKRVDDLIKK
jgi:DNA polymerase-3 subunit alpha